MSAPPDLIRPFANLGFVRQAWDKVFVSKSSYGDPFKAPMQVQMVFYPTNWFHLASSQYRALVKASQAVGDDHFLLSNVEYAGDWVAIGDHWQCFYPPYEQYLRSQAIIENALYSPSGSWGIIISPEEHAVVAGLPVFMHVLKSEYPTWREDLQRLVVAWESSQHGEWVKEVCRRITTA